MVFVHSVTKQTKQIRRMKNFNVNLNDLLSDDSYISADKCTPNKSLVVRKKSYIKKFSQFILGLPNRINKFIDDAMGDIVERPHYRDVYVNNYSFARGFMLSVFFLLLIPLSYFDVVSDNFLNFTLIIFCEAYFSIYFIFVIVKSDILFVKDGRNLMKRKSLIWFLLITTTMIQLVMLFDIIDDGIDYQLLPVVIAGALCVVLDLITIRLMSIVRVCRDKEIVKYDYKQ